MRGISDKKGVSPLLLAHGPSHYFWPMARATTFGSWPEPLILAAKVMYGTQLIKELMNSTIPLVMAVALCSSFTPDNLSCAQGTAFSYPGRLGEDGASVNRL